MTEEMEKKLPTTQRRMTKSIIPKKEKTGECHAAAHAASVDDTADGQLHDPDSQRRITRLNPTAKTSSSRKKADTTQTAIHPSAKFLPNSPEDELEPWVDHFVRASTKRTTCWQRKEARRGSLDRAGFAGSRQRMISTHHKRTLDKDKIQMESSEINQARRVPETRKTDQETGRRRQRIPTINQNQQRQQQSHERHDLAHNGTRWLEMGLKGKRLCKQQTEATNTTHDPHHHDCDNPTNNTQTKNAHDHDEGGTHDDDEKDDGDTLRVFSHVIDS